MVAKRKPTKAMMAWLRGVQADWRRMLKSGRTLPMRPGGPTREEVEKFVNAKPAEFSW